MSEHIQPAAATGAYTTNGKPNLYTTLTPFIVVNHPSEAIEFYKDVFRAAVVDITEFTDEHGQRIIVHAELNFGNGMLQLGAANPSFHLVLPPDEDNACYSLAIYVPDVDRTYEHAVAKGAKVREPIANFVSGDRYGSILDPYGVRWSIMTRVEDLSPEESTHRVQEWAKSFSAQ